MAGKPRRATSGAAVLGAPVEGRRRDRPVLREQRTGYVLGDWAVHKEPGRGVYFWTLTHRPTGTDVNAYPPPETKAQALEVLERYAAGGVPEHKRALLAGHPLLETRKTRRGARVAGRVTRKQRAERTARKARGVRRARAPRASGGREWRFADGKVFYTLAGARRHAAR